MITDKQNIRPKCPVVTLVVITWLKTKKKVSWGFDSHRVWTQITSNTWWDQNENNLIFDPRTFNLVICISVLEIRFINKLFMNTKLYGDNAFSKNLSENTPTTKLYHIKKCRKSIPWKIFREKTFREKIALERLM